MNAKALSTAIGAVLLMCHAHLTIAAAGVGFSVPVVLLAVAGIAGACLVLAVAIIRNLHSCHPYLRTVS